MLLNKRLSYLFCKASIIKQKIVLTRFLENRKKGNIVIPLSLTFWTLGIVPRFKLIYLLIILFNLGSELISKLEYIPFSLIGVTSRILKQLKFVIVPILLLTISLHLLLAQDFCTLFDLTSTFPKRALTN